MPRLTVFVPEGHSQWLADQAHRMGLPSSQDYLRIVLSAASDTYETASRVIPPFPPANSAPLYITLADHVAQRLTVIAQRLGYPALSGLIRTIIEQEANPYERTARRSGFAHGQALQDAIGSGEAVAFFLYQDERSLANVVSELVRNLRVQPFTTAEQQAMADLLDKVATAIRSVAHRRPLVQADQPVTSRDIERWASSEMPAGVTYTRDGQHPTLVEPEFAPEDYIAKYWCLLSAVASAGRLGTTARAFSPEVLGDSWVEVLQTLSLIAQTKGRLTLENPSADHHDPEPEHAAKFAGLPRAIQESRARGGTLLIAYPSVLGDDYEEILSSLAQIATGEGTLAVGRPQPGAYSLQDLFF